MYDQHPALANLAASVFLSATAVTIVPAAFFATRPWTVEVKSNQPLGPDSSP